METTILAEVSRHEVPLCATCLSCANKGRDSIISALHWGPLPEVDGFYKTSGQHQVRRTDYTSAYHTFGLEWSEDYLFTYIDSRLLVRATSPCLLPCPGEAGLF